MAKCWQCNRSGLFLSVGSSSGLCVNCLELAVDASAKLISMIKKDGGERQKALFLIDQETAVAMATEAASALKISKFSMWQQSIHADIEQLKRIRRSKSVVILCFDSTNNQATVLGSEGNRYTTGFSSCSCPDFSTRHLPCKHMYKVAAEHGGIDFTKYI